jgi:hypothetical protein
MTVSREELLCALKGLTHLCTREHGLERTEACLRSALGRPKGATALKGAIEELKQRVQQPQSFSFSRVARWADQSDEDD